MRIAKKQPFKVFLGTCSVILLSVIRYHIDNIKYFFYHRLKQWCLILFQSSNYAQLFHWSAHWSKGKEKSHARQKKPESDGKNKRNWREPRQRAESGDNEIHWDIYVYSMTVNGASGVKGILLMCSPVITIHNCQIKLIQQLVPFFNEISFQ